MKQPQTSCSVLPVAQAHLRSDSLQILTPRGSHLVWNQTTIPRSSLPKHVCNNGFGIQIRVGLGTSSLCPLLLHSLASLAISHTRRQKQQFGHSPILFDKSCYFMATRTCIRSTAPFLGRSSRNLFSRSRLRNRKLPKSWKEVTSATKRYKPRLNRHPRLPKRYSAASTKGIFRSLQIGRLR